MPLLLPVNFPEAIPVLVQSLPTDWNAVRYSTWGNGIGVGLGALLAGLISYVASTKAHNRSEKNKVAGLVYRLARLCLKDINDIKKKRQINVDLGRPEYNLAERINDYKERIDEMCVLIELNFPKDESLVNCISEDVIQYFNEEAFLSLSSHPEVRQTVLGNHADPEDFIEQKRVANEILEQSIRDRLEPILLKFKKISNS